MKKIKNWNLDDFLECEYASDGFKNTLCVVVYLWFLFIVGFC